MYMFLCLLQLVFALLTFYGIYDYNTSGNMLLMVSSGIATWVCKGIRKTIENDKK